jgi:outer membrane lipoprotein LolB
MPARLRGRFGPMAPLFAALLAAVALAGCASLAGPSVPDADLEFELQGRIALHYGEEGGSARINWRHAPAADDLFVTNPMGQGIARITRQAEEVRLVTADGKSYQAKDAESLTQSVLGWRLPLAGLPDWVRGRPVPGLPAEVKKDGDGRPERIAQDDWTIAYTAWQGELPSRLTLTRTGIEIRLVVDEWSKQ